MSAESDRIALQEALAASGTERLEALLPRLRQEQAGQPLTAYAEAELALRKAHAPAAFEHAAVALALMLGRPELAAAGRVDLGAMMQGCMALAPERLRTVLPYARLFGLLLDRSGHAAALAERFAPLAAPLLEPRNQARIAPLRAQVLLALLGFQPGVSEAWGEVLFERLVLPWIGVAAAQGALDLALLLETLAANAHVKRRESQDWFKSTTGRWIPQLAEGARRLAPRFGPPHAHWREEPVRRVGFFVHNATRLAHVQVLLETLGGVQAIGARDYDFTVFVFGGRDAAMQADFEARGVHVRYLDEGGAEGFFERLLRLQRILREENFVCCVWTSLVTIMPVAFALRIAPVQAWWAMKYHACELPEIDARLALEHVVTRKRMDGHEWLTIGNASSEWLDPSLAAAAAQLRAKYPADSVVAGCIGREEKLDSPEFLDAIVALLQAHPRLVFIWTGRVQRASIQARFERAGVAGRTHFAGWVNTKLYAQALDVFLDSFPFPCGFSLKEAMAAGKPSVVFRSPESLETGIPGGISPVARGEVDPGAATREALRAIFTDRADFDLYLCADTPAQYVAMASRLVEDAALRARAGAANRAYIEQFVSSPQAEAAKFLDHLDTLCAAAPRAGQQRATA